MASPIRSQAQHAMLTKAASDPEYAKLRGITQDDARDMLQAHIDSGSPTLPAQVTRPGGHWLDYEAT